MSQEFRGRFAMVAGDSGGINLAIGRGLAAAGAKVLLVSRNSDRLALAARDQFGHIDLLGTFNVFRAAHDVVRRPASMLAITAPQAATPFRQQAHVCAAKAGVNMVVRVLAMEWGVEGIRVNGLSPGPIEGTEGVERMAAAYESPQAWSDQLALRRFGSMEEIVAKVSPCHL